MENIREKIVNATVIQHDGDIEKYLIFVKQNLRMIMSQTMKMTWYNGLMTYVFCQLKTTQNKIFLPYIQDLHVSYQEGTLP